MYFVLINLLTPFNDEDEIFKIKLVGLDHVSMKSSVDAKWFEFNLCQWSSHINYKNQY